MGDVVARRFPAAGFDDAVTGSNQQREETELTELIAAGANGFCRHWTSLPVPAGMHSIDAYQAFLAGELRWRCQQ